MNVTYIVICKLEANSEFFRISALGCTVVKVLSLELIIVFV